MNQSRQGMGLNLTSAEQAKKKKGGGGMYTMTLRIVISNSLIIPMNNTVHREWM